MKQLINDNMKFAAQQYKVTKDENYLNQANKIAAFILHHPNLFHHPTIELQQVLMGDFY